MHCSSLFTPFLACVVPCFSWDWTPGIHFDHFLRLPFKGLFPFIINWLAYTEPGSTRDVVSASATRCR
jgi:hypothetical protein